MTVDNVLDFPRMPAAKLLPDIGSRPHRRQAHFEPAHPLAEIARRRCRELGHHNEFKRAVGLVACGECWEAVIRADERIVVECDLDDAEPVPADDIDEIAVELAMRGQHVVLSAAEQATAIRRLHDAGLTVHQTAARLRLAHREVREALDFGSNNDTATHEAGQAA